MARRTDNSAEASATDRSSQVTCLLPIVNVIIPFVFWGRGCFIVCGDGKLAFEANLTFLNSRRGKPGPMSDRGDREPAISVSSRSDTSASGSGNEESVGGGGSSPRGLEGVTVLVDGSYPKKFHKLVKSPRVGRSGRSGIRCKPLGGLAGLSAGVNAKNKLSTGDIARPEAIKK